MRAQEPSVVYARIDHNRMPPHHLSNQNPLMIATNGGSVNGGGVSPNSLMNTSLDSSSAASTSSRNPDATKIRSRRAPSSVEDEGFNSCSGYAGGDSPDGVPIIISPQSDLTKDTVNLVSAKPPGSSPGSSGASSFASSSSPTFANEPLYSKLLPKPRPPSDETAASSVPLLADCKESHV